MKNIIPAVLVLLASCADGPIYSPRQGEAHLELTGVQTPGPQKLTLLFSEDLSGAADLPSSFTVTNASTGDMLPQASAASVAGQTVTLSLADPSYGSPYRLADGHVYDVGYSVSVPVDAVSQASEDTDETVTAAGTARFTASFLPPAPENVTAAMDSAGNILVAWDADNRIGNTGLELWCVTRASAASAETETKIADLVPYESVYLDTEGSAYSKKYRLAAVNGTGTGGLSSAAAAVDAGVGTFSVLGTCMKNETFAGLPAGYSKVTATATCGKVEYYSSTDDSWIVRELSAAGIRQTDVDSTGASAVTYP